MKQAFSSKLKSLVTALVMTVAVAALTVAPVAACKPAQHQSHKNQHVSHSQDNGKKHGHKKHVDHSRKHTGSVLASHTSKSVKKSVPGDNGTVKVHKASTSVADRRNEPKVCAFYLDAFGFDAHQSVNWHIVQHTHGKTALTGSIDLTNGNGHTSTYHLPNGMYKLYWNFAGEHGSAKHKVFKVSCPAPAAHTKPQVKPAATVKTSKPSTGHVLATSTTVPGKGAATELANTGQNAAVAAMIALFMTASAATVYFAKNRKNRVTE